METIPWNISKKDFNGIVRKFQFEYLKWDAYVEGKLRIIPESLLISAQELQTTLEICLRTSNILSKLENKIKTNKDNLLKLAIPEKVCDLIRQEPDSKFQLTRYDIFKTDDNRWMFTEFNEDVPGGFNETIAAPDLLSEIFPSYSFENLFKEQLLSAFSEVQGTIALMYASGYSEDLQHMAILEKLLNQAGKKTILSAPSQLTSRWGKPTVNAEEISAVIRFYPGEWFGLLPNYTKWKGMLPRIKMLNPLTRLIRQSKNLFALWKDESLLDAPDLEFLLRHTPETHFFDYARHDYESFPRDEWLIKHAFGRMGDSVTMGSLVDESQWKKTWEEANKRPSDFTIQRKFNVSPLSFNSGQLYPTLGIYLINNQFAGFYSRAAEKPFLTHEAYYVPTLVSPA